MNTSENFQNVQNIWADKIYNWDIASAKRIREKNNFSKKDLVSWVEEKLKMAYNYFIQHRDPDVIQWIKDETELDFK